MSNHELWDLASRLRTNYRWVDLTHAFFPGQPRFEPLPDQTTRKVFTVEEDGFAVEQHTIVSQWGTHVDAPVHFVANARTLDDIPVTESILPLAVLDLHEEAEENPDLEVSVDHLLAWEERNGRIPAQSFVALRTDWSKRWDSNTLSNFDDEGKRHSPGWGIPALRFLREERDVLAIGHETTDTDPGFVFDREGGLPGELFWLQQDRWQIELMSNLAEVPETGSLIVASWPKPKNGVGFTARVFAIVPVE